MADASTNTATAAKKATKAAPAAGEAGQTVTVVGPPNGRWRNGTKFTSAPTKIDLSTISAAQLAAIKSDPKLHIVAE